MSLKGEISQNDYYRKDELRNRIPFSYVLGGTTLTTGVPLTVHTVTVGKKLYITDVVVTYYNDVNTIGQFTLNDSGVNKLAYLAPAQPFGTSAGIAESSPNFQSPIEIGTELRITQLTGAITLSINIIGYEE